MTEGRIVLVPDAAARATRTDKALAAVRRALAAGPEWALVWNLKNVDHAAADACKAALRAAGATVVTATSDTLPRALELIAAASGGCRDAAMLPPGSSARVADDDRCRGSGCGDSGGRGGLRALVFGPLSPQAAHDCLAACRALVTTWRPGAVADTDVVLPEGATTLPPEFTRLFQAANVATMIRQAMINVVRPRVFWRRGDVIPDGDELALLETFARLAPHRFRASVAGTARPHVFDAAWSFADRQWWGAADCAVDVADAAGWPLADLACAAAATRLAPSFVAAAAPVAEARRPYRTRQPTPEPSDHDWYDPLDSFLLDAE